MTRGSFTTQTRPLQARLRSTTAILAGLLLLSPAALTAEELRWQGDGGNASANWNFNDDFWLDAGDNDDDYDEDNDNVTFEDINGGAGYTVTVRAGGNNRDMRVNDMTFDVDGVTIDREDNRTIEMFGTITVNDDGVGAQDVATLEVPISDGDIIKAGDGRLLLSGANTTNDAVQVNAGRLNVNGTLTQPSSVTVNDGATLGGTGTVTSNVTLNDTGRIFGGLTIDGDVGATNAGSSIVLSTGGEITGTTTIAGATAARGGTFGAVINTGTFDVEEDTDFNGRFDQDGALVNSTGADVTLSAPGRVFDNTGSISTQDGGGAGSMTIAADAINLRTGSTVTGATGSLTLEGAVSILGTMDYTSIGTITGTVDVEATAAFNNGGQTVTSDIDSLGAVTISGGTVGSVSVDGGLGTFTSGQTTNNVDVGGTAGDAVNSVANFDGDFQVGGDLIIQGGTGSTAGVNVTNNSTLTVVGDVTMIHDSTYMASTLTVDDGSTLDAGTYTIGEDAAVNNSGILTGGLLTNNGGVITNTGTGVISAAVRITDGQLDNSGTVSGVIELDGDNAVLNTVAVVDPGTPSTTSALVTNTNGTINAAGGNFSGGVDNFDLMDVTADTAASTIDNGAGGQLTVNAGVTLTADVDQTGNGTVTVDDGQITGDVSASAGNVALNGVIDGTATISGTGILTTGFESDGTTPAQITGLVINSGTINASNTTFDAGIRNDTNGDLNVLAAITGDITNNGGDTIVSAQVDGDVTVEAGLVDNSSQITGNVLVNGGTFDNETGAQVDGTVTNAGGTINANSGVFGSGAQQLIDNNSGALNITATYANLDVNADGGTVTINSGVQVTGDFDQNGATTNNSGNVVDTLVVADGEFNNIGTVTGSVSVTGGQFDMDDTGTPSNVTGVVTVDGGTVNANGGTFGGGDGDDTVTINDGTLNVTANTVVDVVNAGGQFNLAGAQLDGNLDNQSGDADLSGSITGNVDVAGDRDNDIVTSSAAITGTVELTGGRFVADGGSITGQVTNNGGTLHLDGVMLTTDVDNNSGLTQVIGNTTADIENLGGDVEIDASQTLTGTLTNTSGDTINNGTLDGNVTIADGLFRNFDTVTGTITASGGTVNMRGGEIQGTVTNNGAAINAANGTFATVTNNSGTLTIQTAINATTVTNAGGDLVVEEAATLTSAVNMTSGDATLSGTVDGTVDLTGGTMATDGTITGVLTVNGTGVLTVNDDSVFDATVQSLGGDIFVEGTMDADVNNDGGALRIQNAGDISGDVTLASGLANNAGIIRGDVDISGGTFNLRNAGQTRGLTTLSAGTLNAEGGDFDGGLLTTGGTLNITADTLGDIENDGANLILPAGFTLTGDMTNTSGNMSVRSAVDGIVTITDGNVGFNAASSVTGRVTQNGGTTTINGGSFDGDFAAEGGTTSVDGNMTGKLRTGPSGDVTVASGATVDGLVNMRGGQLVNRGTIDGRVILRNSAQFAHRNGTITGTTVVRDGTMVVNGGAFAGDMNIKAGVVEFETSAALDVDVATGDDSSNNLVVRNGVTLTGDVVSDGRFRLQGTLDGDIRNNGTLNLGSNASITGVFSNNGTLLFNGASIGKLAGSASPVALSNGDPILSIGTLENDVNGDLTFGAFNPGVGDATNVGAVAVVNDQIMFADSFANGNGGTLTLDEGDLDTGSFAGEAGSTLTMRNGIIETVDTLTTAGLTNTRGDDAVVIGDMRVSGRGTMDLRADLTDIQGTLSTSANSRIDLVDARTLRTDGLTMRGVLAMGDGSTVQGDVVNMGRITGAGTLNFAGDLRSSGRVTIAGNDSTDDRLNVGGRLTGGTYALDIDIGRARGRADRIVMTSDTVISGDIVFDFTRVDTGSPLSEGQILVLDANGSNISGASFTSTGLPTDDPIRIYTLTQAGNGDVVVVDAINDGIAGLAGSVTLTQSLIGSVVNRPTSPFVSGLALEGEDPCGAGLWARATGGQATTRGTVTQGGREGTLENELDADYYGVQLGGDWACFGGFYNGWDMAFGGILGANFGNTTQPVFDQSQGLSNDAELQSVTNVDFTQTYAGVYATAVQGPLALDLQYRIEQTEFTANNEGQNGNSGLGLEDEVYQSEAQTLSGAVSYSIPLEEYDVTFVPTAGFAYSRISTDDINFAQGNTEIGSVTIDDFESQVGFIGGTLARTKFGDDGVSAISQFLTATVYNDFAPDPVSTFTLAADGETRSLTSENLGTYGELSAGLNYVRILQPGEFGAVRQFNAAVRADVRYSDQLESWGLTAQARLQF